ncbi:hypothetical protein CVV68_07505 [Arthrobacter livingstonensis]|uniref:AAA domain-containing protein n=1 Tax=Arthrobacter livingstonensis TaxID=670078 RepID=A0A2V5L9L7_9MICC|nr:hypothetical protein CVV68_07505 [Arthrobacter livingstonensis]
MSPAGGTPTAAPTPWFRPLTTVEQDHSIRWTGRERAKTILALDLPEMRQLIQADPKYLSRVDTPVLIDEWQHVPEVWHRARRLADSDSTGERFILAGSAAPVGAHLHSGAGRIISFRMRLLSIAERHLATPTVRSAICSMETSLTSTVPVTSNCATMSARSSPLASRRFGR